MIKRIVLMLFMSISVLFSAYAQSLTLGIAIPDTEREIDSQTAKSLSTRVKKILANTDMADGGSDFMVVPKASILEEDLIESGMKNIFKVKLDLTLEVVQLSTGKVFGSTSVELKGSGIRNKQAAFKNAITSLPTNNPRIEEFFRSTKKKIQDYYESNTANLIAKAKTAASQNNYEEAFAILGTYPEGIRGSEQAQTTLVQLYAQYCKINCEHSIKQARAAIATKNYDLALSILSEVDSSTPCSSTANSLIASIKREIRQAEAQDREDMLRREDRAYNLKQMQINASHDLAKTRINAARDVAKAYYQRTYPNYTIIL